MSISPLAGKPAPKNLLVDVARLERDYFDKKPDPTVARQLVSFGTSGHRGSSRDATFTEAHILAITQAICEYRKSQGIDGPVMVGKDTHALSAAAQRTAIEVLAGNGVEAHVQRGEGDTPTPVFSFLGQRDQHPQQVPCWITHTNARTHEIIRAALDRSPLYTGVIEGIGPRYCPSIEDKVNRFAHKASHQIFLEPEGLTVSEFYPNGISTSLPYDAQVELVRSIRGLERAHVTRPGYAIEYDYFDPRALKRSLETRAIGGLFFAGQINGTTGYEEAAAQGLVAGLNAARAASGAGPFEVTRAEGYVGVLIDDIVTRGVTDPKVVFSTLSDALKPGEQLNQFPMAPLYENAARHLVDWVTKGAAPPFFLFLSCFGFFFSFVLRI